MSTTKLKLDGSGGAITSSPCENNDNDGTSTRCAQKKCTSTTPDGDQEVKEASSAALPTTVEDCAKQLSNEFTTLSVTPKTPCQLTPTSPPSSSTNHDDDDGIQKIIGSGNEVYEIKICIEKVQQLVSIANNRNATASPAANQKRSVWLSYRFGNGNVVKQSDIFTISGDQKSISGFIPMTNSFRYKSSLPELVRHFNNKKNSTLKIHLCTEGEVLGTSFVDVSALMPAIHEDDTTSFEGRMIRREYIVKSKRGGVDELKCPRLAVRLVMDCEQPPEVLDSTFICSSSTSAQTMNTTTCTKDKASSPILQNATNDKASTSAANDVCSSTSLIIQQKEKQLHAKEKEIYLAVATLEKKKCEFEQWRHQQELQWHEKLREKEAAMMRAVEERVSRIECERLNSTDTAKNEYERLETRLRKALIDVETKERQLKEIELSYQNERKRKLSDLESREKLLKRETEHAIEIERAKVKAAAEQAVQAQKASAERNKKVVALESQMDKLRETPSYEAEVSLMRQLAELKGQLADSERRIEAIRAEKNLVTTEKEQFRQNVHKLARALRQEREKARKSKRECNNQQQGVKLRYDSNEKCFFLNGGSGGGGEIQRIISDLSKISQIRSSPMQSSSGDIRGESAPPLPSPQPSRPSMMITTPTGCDSLNFDGILANAGCSYGLPIFPDPIKLSRE